MPILPVLDYLKHHLAGPIPLGASTHLGHPTAISRLLAIRITEVGEATATVELDAEVERHGNQQGTDPWGAAVRAGGRRDRHGPLDDGRRGRVVREHRSQDPFPAPRPEVAAARPAGPARAHGEPLPLRDHVGRRQGSCRRAEQRDDPTRRAGARALSRSAGIPASGRLVDPDQVNFPATGVK